MGREQTEAPEETVHQKCSVDYSKLTPLEQFRQRSLAEVY